MNHFNYRLLTARAYGAHMLAPVNRIYCLLLFITSAANLHISVLSLKNYINLFLILFQLHVCINCLYFVNVSRGLP